MSEGCVALNVVLKKFYVLEPRKVGNLTKNFSKTSFCVTQPSDIN